MCEQVSQTHVLSNSARCIILFQLLCGCNGGCEIAVSRRCRLGWIKFNELGSILTGRRHTMRIKGKIYKACIITAMVYCSKTWNVKTIEEGILRRTERAMICTKNLC